MNEEQGASHQELVIEAARRNNVELLNEIIKKEGAWERVAHLLNNARDPVGNGVLHLAALNGNYEILDVILDQEGVEIDEIDRMEKDTPLHKAVRYSNGLDKEDWAHGREVVDILVDAGCDPRIRNKAKLKPVDLVDPRHEDLRKLLQKAEYALQMGDDVVQEDADDDEGDGYETP